MKRFYKPFSAAAPYAVATFLAASTLAFAQDQSAPPTPEPQAQQQMGNSGGGWPRASVNPPDPYQTADSGQNQTADSSQNQGEPLPPQDEAGPRYNDGNRPYAARPPYAGQEPPPVPSQLTLAPGTYVTVRVNQYLSSDRNQKGDAFSATLVQPIVVNGVVVAEPGQTLGGQVVESQKAGRVEGVARLGIQLTDLTLVDGQQVPIQSQLISRKGDTSVGRDAGAIAGTTGVGAAIGAGVGGGAGAAVGAGAGLLVSTIGVLVTRGHPSVVYPEQVLTFRIQAPVAISTANAPMAFRYVEPNEYGNNPEYRGQPGPGPDYANAGPPPAPSPYYAAAYPYPAPYYYGYGYGYPYWGPSIGFYFGGGRGYWGHGGYYGGRAYFGGRGGYYGGHASFAGRGGYVGGHASFGGGSHGRR